MVAIDGLRRGSPVSEGSTLIRDKEGDRSRGRQSEPRTLVIVHLMLLVLRGGDGVHVLN